MDKASVARVCIMFNYKNIYSLKIFKIMSICCAFSFSFLYLSRVEGWDKKCVGLAPLEDITRALWFPFPEVPFPFLVLVSVPGRGPHALNSQRVIRAREVRLWLMWPQGCRSTGTRPPASFLSWPHAFTYASCAHSCTGEGVLGPRSHPEETCQVFFLFSFNCCFEPFKILVTALFSPLLYIRVSNRILLL